MKWKKVLSVLLALCMVLSMTVMTALAEETGTEATQENSQTSEEQTVIEQDVSDGDAISELTASDDGTRVFALTTEDGSETTTGLTEANDGDIDPELTAANNTEVSTWDGLQQALNSGGYIKLTGNITAASSDGALEVPVSVTVTLDLNGFTINRALQNSPTFGGFVLRNWGTLTITDNSSSKQGTITGGNNSINYSEYAGGGICNLGTLTLEGGSISGNRSLDCAGIYNARGCTFHMTGGTISNNTAEYEGGGIGNYGAVYMSYGDILQNTAGTRGGGIFTGGSYASVNMSGGTLWGNTAKSSGGGIYASESEVVISGGDIMSNTASGSSTVYERTGFGGGIYGGSGADITVTGGKIRVNSALHGGGAYMDYDCSLTMSGSPEISGNNANDGRDLYLGSEVKIHVNGAFTESADVGVYSAQGSDVTITSGYSENNTLNPAKVFSSSITGLDVLLDALGEVWIGEGLPISLTQSAAKVVTLDSSKAYPNTTITLTAISGTKPVVQYTNTNKQTITVDVTDNGNDTWSFTMPNAPVAVDVRYTNVPYIERTWAESAVVSQTKTCDEIKPVPDNANMTSGWYYLNSKVTKNGRIESITGDVHLILGDGLTLDVKGLYVPPGTTLTIYAQSDGTGAGRIYSHPSGGAAIGGYSGHDNGNIVIKGGTIEAVGYDHCAGIGSNDDQKGGNITIYGGTITAKGGSDGAGIGGGRNRDGGNITIYGGTIKANEDPNENAAAIGGGDNGAGGEITIWGGEITAWSRDGAGIGGGADAGAGVITINGGDITVNDVGQANGARIGSGDNASGGKITINGGKITVYYRDGAGIGCAEDGGVNKCEITINGGEIHCEVGEDSEGNGAGIGGGNNSTGGKIIINDGNIGIKAADGAGIGGGDDGNGGEITINGGSIYIDFLLRNEKQIGNGAGIGGGNHADGGNITIQNGNITIYAVDGAGIGGGREDDTFMNLTGESGDGGNITINGGTLKISSYYAYAIGAGGPSGRAGSDGDPFSVFTEADIGNAGNITITGGNIEVQGYAGAAAIGGDTGEIVITGGKITPIMHANNQYTISLIREGKVDISGGEVDGRMIRAYEQVSITGGSHSFSRILDNKKTIETDELVLGDNMMVKAGTGNNGHLEEHQTPVPVADRAKKLQEKGNDNLWTTVKACEHPGETYTMTASSHTGRCDYCKTAFTAEEHDFVNGICIVCRYINGDYVVTFDPDNGNNPYSVAVYSGKTVARPAEDPVRDSYIFQGWYQVTGTNSESLAEEPFNFETLITNNITLKAKWEELKPVVKAHALLLSGEIGVKFRVAFPKGFDTSNFRIVFRAADGRSSIVRYDDSTAIEGSTDRYFIFNINALELAEQITATLYRGEKALATDKYSAMNYIQYVQENWSDNAKLLNLVNSLQAYGYYMQQSGWTDDKDVHTPIPQPEKTLTTADVVAATQSVSKYVKTDEFGDSGIDTSNFSLTLNAQTVINISVKPTEGVVITSTGYRTFEKDGVKWYVFSTPQIGPKNLGKDYTVTIQTDHGTATVSASAMAYVNAILGSDESTGFTEAQKYAMAAYYYYYDAAAKY